MSAILPANQAGDTEPVDDRQAVAAVLQGDPLAYRKLVERYERLVYAVTWSRLGDAALAEDAAQEAFIRAYQSLPLLGDHAKFSVWITTIARNTAIKLGLKQRRELAKRARWALEQPVAEAPAVLAAEACPPELLRQTLAELSDEHRESLVLYYLEGRSGAEVAAALGISEAALRMRLLRARGALREKLEARLDESLRQLRPSRSLTPSVMAAVTSSSLAKSTGWGAALLSMLGKILPVKFAAMLAPAGVLAPVFALAWFSKREQERNYRDPTSLYARHFRQVSGQRLWYFAGFLLITVLAFGLYSHQGMPTSRLNGIVPPIIALVWLISLGVEGRQLIICHNPYQVKRFLCSVIMLLYIIGEGDVFGIVQLLHLYSIEVTLILWPLMLYCSFSFAVEPSRELNQQNNDSLFLRAAAQRRNPPAPARAVATATTRDLGRAKLLAFARFLGARYLVRGYRWTEDGLQLRLPLLGLAIFDSIFRIWQKCSWIRLGWDGAVTAQCGPIDEKALRRTSGEALPAREELEALVVDAVQLAWASFDHGDLAAAEKILWKVPDEEMFIKLRTRIKIKPPPRKWGVFWLIWLAALATICLILWLH